MKDHKRPKRKPQAPNNVVRTVSVSASTLQLQNTLLSFVDFIYAVVFVLVIQETYQKIISPAHLPLQEKLLRFLMVGAVFYLLAWDWVLGRILTLRNPYRSYTRFFCEVVIAILAYGAARAIVNIRLTFLLYFAGILVTGVLWARRTLQQLTNKRDEREICVISWVQSIGGILMFLLYLVIPSKQQLISPLTVAIIAPGVWLFIFSYELLVPRNRGLPGGPGAPFLSRPDLRKVRRFVLRGATRILYNASQNTRNSGGAK